MILASYGFFAIFSQGLTNSMASVVQKHGTLTGPGYFGVSIPNGLPRPFSLCVGIRGSVVIVWVSIPNGLPRPFSLPSQLRKGSVSGVSIPNGLPRPFSLSLKQRQRSACRSFQSRTGSPGHLARFQGNSGDYQWAVSIPNGLPRPFSHQMVRTLQDTIQSFNPERAPQAI